MHECRLSLCVVLLILLEVCICKQQYALNVPRVLLPLVASGVRSNFTITATQGCFTWTSTKPDVASVEPIMEPNGKKSCSRKAIITAQSSQTIRLSSVIIAEEVGGGVTLRCDVFVDTIYRIEITTRTRELLLEEEPERFELQAFDDEGNMFSTLNGHVVDWTFLVDEDNVDQTEEPGAILNFIPFEESTYSTDPVIRRLEAEGLQGDIVLVAGISTGSVKVQATPMAKIWKKVEPSVVKLLVMENLMLIPSMDVYILIFSFVDYHIQRRKHGRIEMVPLPSNRYSLSLSNSTVGELNPELSRVTGLVLGYTEVIVEDQNMVHMPTATKPTAGIYVVTPHHLGFVISGNVWVLETGKTYVIVVHVFAKNNHKIHLNDHISLLTTLPQEHLTVHFSSINGTHHHVTALKAGHTSLLSVLSSLKHPVSGEIHTLSIPVSKKQLLEIYDPIRVHPRRLALLWEEQMEFHYRYSLKAFGGSGSYFWSCDPEGVVSVTGNGTLNVLELGMTRVYAADVKNKAHFNHSEVHVVPPARMTFLPSPVEAVVGHTLYLPLQVVGFIGGDESDSLAFPDCRKIRINISLSDPSIFNISNDREGEAESLPEGACLVLVAMAIAPGHTQVVVSYEGIAMEAVVTIAGYLLLAPINPEHIAIVTLGASKLFVFEGGPSPWILDRSKFFKNLSAELPDKVDLQPWSPTAVGVDCHVYSVTCMELGEQTLSIVVGNGPSLKNMFPAHAEATSRLACALPVTIALHPVLSHMPDCHIYSQDSSQALQFPVLSDSLLELEIRVYDAESRPFDNFTSLHFRWHSSDQDLLPLSSSASLYHHGDKALLVVMTGDVAGTVVVTVSSNSHDHVTFDAFSHIFFYVDPFSPEVTLVISLLLRHKPHLSITSLILYNHPDNQVTISIENGSGYFQVDPGTQDMPHLPAEVIYSPKTHEIVLVPSREGRMRLNVRDLCLYVEYMMVVDILVAGINRVEVMVRDKVQMGSSVMACVQVLSSDGQPFPRYQYKYMNLQAYPHTFHIFVNPSTFPPAYPTGDYISPPPSDSVCFQVDGKVVGISYLSFNVTTVSGKVISSLPKEIQIFDPLNLHPENITLIPGSTFQIQTSGGPKPQGSVLYSVSNNTVAVVNGAGLILAKELGLAIVTGCMPLSDPSHSSHQIAHSEDFVTVRVVHLTGVRIHLPSTRLLSDVAVEVYAVGLDNESPFTFAANLPGLVFQWSVSNMDALSITSVYDKAGVSLQEEQDFSATLHTRNPGQGELRLGVKCPPQTCIPDMAFFTDQIRIQVLSPLSLLRPLNGHFLLPHNGLARIVTNRDGVSMLSYKVLNECGVGVSEAGLITISSHGEVKTASVNGHAVVMVTENEETFGLNQTLIVHVEVRPITSLSISPISLAQATPNSNHHAFPLGYSAEFIAHLHDNVGRKFDFANVPLSHRLNHLDIVLVTPESGNTTYIVKATKQGQVILKVWVSSLPHIANFVRVRVAYAIIPSLGVVHLGSTLCFSTHLTEDQVGKWEVGESAVMEVEGASGVGLALTVGRTVIYHKIHDVIDTHTEITVAKVGQVVFDVDKSRIPIFTNGCRQRGLGDYLIPVKFLQENGEEFSPLHSSQDKRCLSRLSGDRKVWSGARLQQVPFECHLELREQDGSNAMVTEYIVTETTFDPSTGATSCKLLPLDTDSAEGLSVKDDLQLSLKVVAFDLTRTYSVTSEKLAIPFVSAFYIERKEVILSAKDSSTELIIRGLPMQLQTMKVLNPYPLSVVRTSSATTVSATYKLSVLPDYHSPPEPSFTNLTVSFLSPYSQQEELVYVTFAEDLSCETPHSISLPGTLVKKGHTPPSLASSSQLPIIIGLIFLLILILLVTCVALQKSSNSTSGFQLHLPPGGQTPIQSYATAYTSVNTTPFSMHAPHREAPGIYPTPSIPSHQRMNSPQHTPFLGTGPSSTASQRRTRASSSPKQTGLFSQ